MKKVTCTVLIFALIIFLINQPSSEARGGGHQGGHRGGYHGGYHGDWWVPWAVIGGAAILSTYYGRYYYPTYDPYYYPYYAPPPGVVVPPSYMQRGPVLPSPPELMGRNFIYPRLGQSEKQQADDEYQCHIWAVTQSGYNPTSMTSGGREIPQSPDRLNDYMRAKSACLDGRGYTMK